MQGHKDKFKNSAGHDISVSSHYLIKLLISLVSLFGFKTFSTDVTQVSFRSSENLQRDKFISSPCELALKRRNILKLIKPSYGLEEGGDFGDKSLGTIRCSNLEWVPLFPKTHFTMNSLKMVRLDFARPMSTTAFVLEPKPIQTNVLQQSKNFKYKNREEHYTQLAGLQTEKIWCYGRSPD